MKNRAFTYIEVLLSVTILGLVLIPLLSQFYTGFQGNVTAELVTQSIDLADEMMEEIKSRCFDENAFPDEPVAPGALGVDPGETSNDRTTFDDVDDYHNWQKSPPQAIDGTVLTNFSEFSRGVNVEYVTVSGADWISFATTTYYKRITVIVSHPKISDRRLETIVSHY
ncbi:MAG: type II secretion system GspH family protein [Candidatus Omnitrophica bacterium]|nr:type II secretion system GspH family protein [Candidatus Omnitrophota bacterium]